MEWFDHCEKDSILPQSTETQRDVKVDSLAITKGTTTKLNLLWVDH